MSVDFVPVCTTVQANEHGFILNKMRNREGECLIGVYRRTIRSVRLLAVEVCAAI